MKIRIKFSKTGCMKFIGHLDIMHYFQKAMRRAEVDICYSVGFSPHQIMSFASPLSLGLTSCGEYMDIEVSSSADSKEMLRRLNAVMVEGMEVLSWRLLPDNSKTAMALVAAADYEISFRKGYEPEDMEGFKKDFQNFCSQERIMVTKKTKKSEKEINIRPYIYQIFFDDDVCKIQAASGSADNLKPELVWKAYYNSRGLELPEFALSIHRTQMYGDLGDETNRRLVALEDLGEDII